LPAEARIESLINRDENFALNIDKNPALDEVPSIFKEGMETLVLELLNEQIPFSHLENSKYCQFCT
jgi:hypothetical protein